MAAISLRAARISGLSGPFSTAATFCSTCSTDPAPMRTQEMFGLEMANRYPTSATGRLISSR